MPTFAPHAKPCPHPHQNAPRSCARHVLPSVYLLLAILNSSPIDPGCMPSGSVMPALWPQSAQRDPEHPKPNSRWHARITRRATAHLFPPTLLCCVARGLFGLCLSAIACGLGLKARWVRVSSRVCPLLGKPSYPPAILRQAFGFRLFCCSACWNSSARGNKGESRRGGSLGSRPRNRRPRWFTEIGRCLEAGGEE